MAIFVENAGGSKKYIPYIEVEEVIDAFKPLLRQEILSGDYANFWCAYNTREERGMYCNGGLDLTVSEDFTLLENVFKALFAVEIETLADFVSTAFPFGIGTVYSGQPERLDTMLHIFVYYRDIRYDTSKVAVSPLGLVFNALNDFCYNIVYVIEDEADKSGSECGGAPCMNSESIIDDEAGGPNSNSGVVSCLHLE